MHTIDNRIKHRERGIAMEKSKSVFWSAITLWSIGVLVVREILVSAGGVGLPKAFVVIRGVLEFPVQNVDTTAGGALATVGAVLVTTITYCIARFIMDKKDGIFGVTGLIIGIGVMAAGVAGLSAILWLPVAVAIGTVNACLSERLPEFVASEMLSAQMGIIIGVTAYIALGYGLFAAAVMELLLLCCYWSGVFMSIAHKITNE